MSSKRFKKLPKDTNKLKPENIDKLLSEIAQQILMKE